MTIYQNAPSGESSLAPESAPFNAHDHWFNAGLGPHMTTIAPPDARTGEGAPFPDAGKVPAARRPNGFYTGKKGWQNDRVDTTGEAAKRDASGMGVGLVCKGGLIGLDVDVSDARIVQKIEDVLAGCFLDLPKRVGNAPRALYPMIVTGAEPSYQAIKFTAPDGSPQKIEVLAGGKQFVADGVHPKTGKPYYWPSGRPDNISAFPKLTGAELADLMDAIEAALAANGATNIERTGGHPSSAKPGGAQRHAQPSTQADGLDDETLRRVVEAIPNGPRFATRDDWAAFGFALFAASGGSDLGRELWLEFSARHVGADGKPVAGDPDKDARFWDTIRPGSVTVSPDHILSYLRDANPGLWCEVRFPPLTPEDEAAADELAKQAALDQGAPQAAKTDATKDRWTLLREACGAPPEAQTGGALPFVTFGPGNPPGRPKVRSWVTDLHLRGAVSMTIAAPGTGKSTLAVVNALAIVTERRDIASFEKLERPGAVLFVSNEDGVEEIERKIVATMKDRSLTQADWKHPIKVSPTRLVFVEKDNKSAFVPTLALIEFAKAVRAINEATPVALLIVDTLLSVSRGADPNGGADMGAPSACADILAKGLGCAVELIHHSSKDRSGIAGDLNSALGSIVTMTGLRGAVTLTRPTEKDRTAFGWTEAEAKRRIVLTGAKANQGPEAARRWFEFRAIQIDAEDERDPTLPVREEVATLVPIFPISPVASQNTVTADEAFAVLVKAAQAGEAILVNPHGKTGKHAEARIVRALGGTSAGAEACTAELEKDGRLKKVQKKGPNRKPRWEYETHPKTQ